MCFIPVNTCVPTYYYNTINSLLDVLLSDPVDNTNWNEVYEIESTDEQIRFIEDKINQIFKICVPLKTKNKVQT